MSKCLHATQAGSEISNDQPSAIPSGTFAQRNRFAQLNLAIYLASHEFNSIDEAVVGMQIIGAFGDAQTSLGTLNFRFHITAELPNERTVKTPAMRA
jgi:hypothetical protein